MACEGRGSLRQRRLVRSRPPASRALGAEGGSGRQGFRSAGQATKQREVRQRPAVSSPRLLRRARARHALLLWREARGYLSGFRASSATHLTNYLWNRCIHSHLNKNLSTRRLSFVAAGPLLFPAHPEDDGLEVMQIHCRFICWWLPRRQGT